MFTLWQIVGSRSHDPLSYTIYLLKLVALHGKLARITTEYYHRDIVIYFHMRIQNIPMKYPLYIIIIYICIYIIIYISLYHYISSCCIPWHPHWWEINFHFQEIGFTGSGPFLGLPTTRRRCTDAFGRRRHPTSARCAAWHQRVGRLGFREKLDVFYRFDARNP